VSPHFCGGASAHTGPRRAPSRLSAAAQVIAVRMGRPSRLPPAEQPVHGRAVTDRASRMRPTVTGSARTGVARAGVTAAGDVPGEHGETRIYVEFIYRSVTRL
jgi:hypothetical protein